MKSINMKVVVVLLACFSMNANAGIWDSIMGFFSGSEEEKVTEAAPAADNSAGGLVATGLQLLPLLTQQLGVSGDQAKGGMGALLQTAQVLMSGSDFGKLSQMIPGASAMLSAAPQVSSESSGGLTESVMKMAAEQSDTAKAGMQLVSQFKSLGMGADMIPKFTGVAESYLKQSDDPSTASLLTSALSNVL